MTMAAECGLNAPQTKILTLPSGEDVFLTKRFDRNGLERQHGLSFYSLAPAIQFERLKPQQGVGHSAHVMAQIVDRFTTHTHQNQENLAKKLLVDIAFNNTDNHLRNIRLLLNQKNEWEVSPSFDILFDPRSKPHTYSPAGLTREETHLNNPEVVSLIAKFTNLDHAKVEELKDTVVGVVDRLEEFALKAGVSEQDLFKVKNAVTIGMVGPEVMFKIEEQKRLKFAEGLKPNHLKFK